MIDIATDDGSWSQSVVARVRRSLLQYEHEGQVLETSTLLDVAHLTASWLGRPSTDPADDLGLALAVVIARSVESREAWLRSWSLSETDVRSESERAVEIDWLGRDRFFTRGGRFRTGRYGRWLRRAVVVAVALSALIAAWRFDPSSVWASLLQTVSTWDFDSFVRWWRSSEGVLSGPIIFAVVVPAITAVLWGLIELLRWVSPAPSGGALSTDDLVKSTPELSSLWDDTFRRISKDLRRLGAAQRPTDRMRLDIDATVAASVSNGGLFTAVHRRVFETPHYVFLIGLMDYRDHALGDAARLTSAFRRTGLANDAFFWRPFTGVLASQRSIAEPGPKVRTLDLNGLWSRHPDSTLIMVSHPSSLIDPITLRARAHLDAVKNWTRRILLSATPPATRAEGRAITDLGLVNGPLTFDRFSSVVAVVDPQVADPRRPPALWTTLPPALADDRLLEWTRRDQGNAAWRELKAVLESWLSPQGLAWLGATAVMPFLSWDLTMVIGQSVTDNEGHPLYDENRSRRLTGLVWFRSGRLPASVRRRLLASLDSRIGAQVRDMLDTSCAEGDRSRPVWKNVLTHSTGMPAASASPLLRPGEVDRLTIDYLGGIGRFRLGVRAMGRRLTAILLTALAFLAVLAELPRALFTDRDIARSFFDDLRQAIDNIGDLVWTGWLQVFGRRPNFKDETVLRTYFFANAGVPPDHRPHWRALPAGLEEMTSPEHVTSPGVKHVLDRLLEILESVRYRRGDRTGPGAYIQGGPGWGKSAILQAIVGSHQIERKGLLTFPMVMTGLSAIIRPGPDEFLFRKSALKIRTRRAARWVAAGIRLLCIDDVQPMSALSARTFTEFLSALRRYGVTIIMSSRSLPAALAPGPEGAELARFISQTGLVLRLDSADGDDEAGGSGNPDLALLSALRRHQRVYGEKSVGEAKLYFELGLRRLNLAQFDQAELYLLRAIQAMEHDHHREALIPAPLVALGQALAGQSRYEEAANAFGRAVREIEETHDPDHRLAYQAELGRFDSLVSAGDTASARLALPRVVNIGRERLKERVFADDVSVDVREDMRRLNAWLDTQPRSPGVSEALEQLNIFQEELRAAFSSSDPTQER